MRKARMTKILIEGDKQVLEKFAAEVEGAASIQVEAPPATGLVMTKVRDSVSLQPFYLGEVLVTECTVSINGKFGMGVIMGEEPERSYQLAVVDAAYNAGLPLTAAWLEELEREEKRIFLRQSQESAKVTQSRVNFDTMEDYNDKS